MSDLRRSDEPAGRPPRSRAGRHALSRPPGMLEGTRWLFWLLALISLALSAAPVLSTSRGLLALVGGASVVALGVSCTSGYLRQRDHWAWDLGDAVAIMGLACASPAPGAALGIVFALIWFRSLYGSTRAALLRCVLYIGALSATLALWPYLPGQDGFADPAAVLGSFPTMCVTIVVGRHLAGMVRTREQAARRDAIQAAAGSDLLGVTDATEIRRIAWDAMVAICAVTPGLRVLKVTRAGDAGLRVDVAAGAFMTEPVGLPASLVDGLDDALSTLFEPPPEIVAAVGPACIWSRLALPAYQPGDAWLYVASPTKLSDQVSDSLTSMVNQTTLALRNGHAHQELTVQATLDNLTGLANRALFNASVATALADGTTTETALLFVDLDDFKDVNDVFGHTAGDDLLREVADRLRRATRPGDLCARIGGDEFAVLLPGTGAEVGAEIAHCIVDAVSGPMALTGGVAHLGASVGLAVAVGDTTRQQIIHRADVAMYAAKAAGKGRMQVFSPGLLQEGASQLAFDRELSAATTQGELVVHYQPVLSIPDGRCTAVEALVRWDHPERGLLFPRDFIDAAERTGAIRDIGEFVLRQACADVSRWRRAGAASRLAVHVNVSALQLDDKAFTATVLRCLDEYSIPADQLVLEITETVVLSSPAAIDQLNELAARGVVLAIDDFGTGYSALTTLRSLPVQIVKIDRSFVAGSTVNPHDRAVIEAVVQMASRMGLRTIAEGVERPEQQTFLESIGADAVQGYLYLRPTTAAELSMWLAEHLGGLPLRVDDVVVPFTSRSHVRS